MPGLVLAAALAALSVLASDPRWWSGYVVLVLAASLVPVFVWLRGAVEVKAVLAFAVLFRILLFWLPPVLSDDGYRYVWDGLLQARGLNPFLWVPSDPFLAEFHEHPLYPLLNSAGYFSVYPPVSQLIFGAGGLFHEAGWRVSYYAIKLVLVGLETGGVFLLARLVSARSLVLYAWNPIVVVELAGQAHTEAALVFFLVLTLWSIRSGKGHLAVAALTAAVWVKLYPVVLLPFVLRRVGWRKAWVVPALSLLVFLPYLDPAVPANLAASLDLYVRFFEFNAGPYFVVQKVLYFLTGIAWNQQIGPLFRALFLALIPVLYVLDRRRGWSPAEAMIHTLTAFFLLSTTIHPWYLLGLLALLPLWDAPTLERRLDLAKWLWLIALSAGTYLLYTDGPYWAFVNLGWGGWLLLLLVARFDGVLQRVQRRRARVKFEWIRRYLPASPPVRTVLDLGAGEGYVGAEARKALGAHVELADVIDLNQTTLPLGLIDGRTLPHADRAFDVTVLVFVLHHAADPEALFREALRVSNRRVIVVESVYETPRGLRLLRFLDQAANRLRSRGEMRAQEPHLHFRTVEAWIAFFARFDCELTAVDRKPGLFHRQALFALKPV